MSPIPPQPRKRSRRIFSPWLLAGLSVLLAAVLVATASIITKERGLNLASGNAPTVSEQTVSDAPVSARAAALEDLVTGFVAEHPNTGIVVVDLGDSSTAQSNGDVPFTSASLYKLFVAYDVLSQVDDGSLVLDGWMPEVATTFGDCLDVMITFSDNDCGAALGDHVGWEALDARLADEGYEHTILDNYDEDFNLVEDKITTPNDVTLLLSRLVSGELLSAESTELFMNLLTEQTLNYALPTGLDDTMSYAHKTGLLDEVSHDAGIIFAPAGTFVVVMMTDGWDDAAEESPALFTEFGERFSTIIRNWA